MVLFNNIYIIGVVLVMLLISCFVIYQLNTKNPSMSSRTDGHIDRIIDNIFLGDWFDSTNELKLKFNNIKCILTLNENNVHTEEDRNMFTKMGIRYKYVQIQDSLDANILPHIDSSILFLKKCDDNVLVHCSAGISRSVSIVVAYLIKEKNMSYNGAIDYVRKRRPVANPNYSFAQQLKTLQ
jgi:protein-tyrosine phosphatase